MDTQKKLEVLAQIAEALNRRKVTWAVGASLLLYLKGKAEGFHDIDIMVAEADIEKVEEALSALGARQPAKPNAQYQTKYFLEFDIAGVEVDVMAGFAVVQGGKTYAYPLRPGDVQDFTTVNGVLIPLQSLAEWRVYYERMGRPDKVAMIDRPGPA